jgi:hypothetical protein
MKRFLLRLIVVALLITAAWQVWPFLQSPEGQARKRHMSLFETVSKRNWKAVPAYLAESYEDQWGQKGPEAVEVARELLAGFIILEIRWEPTEAGANDNIVKLRGHARMEGNGLGISQILMTKVNQLQEPWVFTWQKDGWHPSGWRLISITNKELENVGLPADF